jgi:hypothetical protein
MRKAILTLVGAALVIGSAVNVAAAAQHQRVHRDRAAPVWTEPVRNSNAYAPQYAEPDWSRYSSGALSAPAGR